MSSPKSPLAKGRAFEACLVAVYELLLAAPIIAQDLPLRTIDPAVTPHECTSVPITAPAEEGAPEQASDIAREAAEAIVLGDMERARALLERALELDGSSSDLQYRYARVLETLGERDEAIEALCRAHAIGGDGIDSADVATRIDSLWALGRPEVSATARTAFETGVIAARAGRVDAAVRYFGRAAAAQPDWPAARYNLGIVLDRAGRGPEAEEQLRSYLELYPEAMDAVAVSRRVGQLQVERQGGPRSRETALALGLVVPGLGQLYTGRTKAGITVLASVGAVVTAGLLDRRVNVRCLQRPPNASCPPEQVVSREMERPLLKGALAAAGAIMVLAAFEAALHLNPGRSPEPPAGWPLEGAAEAPAAGPPGASSIVLLRIPTPR